MIEMNGLMLQKMLSQEDTVSIAWLQKKLELDYVQARKLSDLLLKRGWLGEESGRGYKVERDCLFLRQLVRSEVGALVDEITSDCYLIMDLLLEQQVDGAAFKALGKKVRGEHDTREAIGILLRNKLIFVKDGYYFLRVSRKTVEACKTMLAKKRLMERREYIDRAKLIACFDELFA